MTLSFTSQVSLTTTARKVIDSAARYAAGDDAAAVEPHHLLLALLDTPSSLAVRALQQIDADPGRLRAALGASVPNNMAGKRELSEGSRQVLLAAYREAQHLGHYQVDAVHLLVGILYDQSQRAAEALEAEGVTLFALRQHLLEGPQRWSNYGWRSYVERTRAAITVSAVSGRY